MKSSLVILFLIATSLIALASTDDLVIGQLSLVEASAEIPYAYWYYVPTSAKAGSNVGLVWHATPGDSHPDDPVFWAKFDLGAFLACNDGPTNPRINLPEKYGMVLFSVAVTEPLPSFYNERAGQPLGTPVNLSSLLTFSTPNTTSDFLDPDLKALKTIDDLKRRLTNAGIIFEPRLFITGVYSGAEWAHRFALLHPVEVRAIAPVCGDWYTLPRVELDGEAFGWPLGMGDFVDLGRGLFDAEAFAQIPYYVTASSHENVWYPQMTPEEQGIDGLSMQRYVDHFGLIPPEHAESFAREWSEAGYPFQIAWSEGGNGWIDPVRIRIFEFFAGFLE